VIGITNLLGDGNALFRPGGIPLAREAFTGEGPAGSWLLLDCEGVAESLSAAGSDALGPRGVI